MEIVNGSALLIYCVIIIIAVLAFWTIIWKQLCSPVWKTIYILIGTGILVFAVYSGYYAINNTVFTERVETSAQAVSMTPSKASSPAEIISSVECYKAAYELFNSQFSNLLTFLGIFGSIFGLIIPAISYFLQRQSIRDERKRLTHNMEKLRKKFKTTKCDFEKNKSSVETEFQKVSDNIRKAEEDLAFVATMIFEGISGLSKLMTSNTTDKRQRIYLLAYVLMCDDSAINYAVKSKNKDELISLLIVSRTNISFFIKNYRAEYEEAINFAKKRANNNDKFVSAIELQQMLGEDNRELYEWYKELYEPIYPWKFNGQQKRHDI